MNNEHQKFSTSRVSHKKFPSGFVSDQAHLDTSPGPHQRLIRKQDGTCLLIVREASGFIRKLPVLVFESGYLA